MNLGNCSIFKVSRFLQSISFKVAITLEYVTGLDLFSGFEPELVLNIKLEEGWEHERATEEELARELASDYECYENLLKENNLYQPTKYRIRNRRGLGYTGKTSPRAMTKSIRMISQSTGLGKSMYNDGCDIHSDQTEDKAIINPELMTYSPFVRRPVKRSVMLQTSMNNVLEGKTFPVHARDINANLTKPRDNRGSKIRKVKRRREEYNIPSWKDRRIMPFRTDVINDGRTRNEVNNVSSIIISDETIYSENKVFIGQARDINAHLQSPEPCLSDTSSSTESAAHAISGGEPEIKSSSVFQKENISRAETVNILITRPRDINILTQGSHVSEERGTLDMKKATKTTASGPFPSSELVLSETITSSPTTKKTKAAKLPVRVAEFICNPSEIITALCGNSQKLQEEAFAPTKNSAIPQPPPLPVTGAPWRSRINCIENNDNSERLQENKVGHLGNKSSLHSLYRRITTAWLVATG